MGKKKAKNSSSKKQKKKSQSSSHSSLLPSLPLYSNFVSEAGPGCYIARRDKSPSWLIEWEDVDEAEFQDNNDSEVPDVAVDTEEQTLSICNLDNHYKVAYVTVYDTRILGADGNELPQGTTTDNAGLTQPCVTFIVLCPPCVFVHLCVLDIDADREITDVQIESDVSPWQQHPNPNDEHPFRIGFPLGKVPESGDMDAVSASAVSPSTAAAASSSPPPPPPPPSFLCTQGENGELTHFFSGNLHAIDFQCPVGTELLAVADGVVIDAQDKNTLTGISVNNLFQWNSILLEICKSEGETTTESEESESVLEHSSGPLFVEYVHIQRSLVTSGQAVKKGQAIGYSGSVGFSPEPHLHFSAFRSSDPTAPTVRVLFEGDNEDVGSQNPPTVFLPRARQRYNASSGRSDP